jgi:predicted dehydrogenase
MIGTGDVTEKKSAPSFNKIDNSQLVAVGNRTPEKAENYARRHGVPTVHRDPMDVIHDPQVEIVYVATPPGSHLLYALETIKAGKPVYLEKPMARTWEECDRINKAAGEAGIPVYVAYYRRSLDYFLKVKELVESGSIGEIRQIHLHQFFAAREEEKHRDTLPWRVIPEHSGGGNFHDMGCHALDIIFYIFGNPAEVYGSAINKGGLYDPEDTLGATLMLEEQILVTGSWSFVAPAPFQNDRVEVIGSAGKISFSVFSFEPITLEKADQMETFAVEQPEHIQMPFIQSIVQELQGSGRCPSTGITAAITNRVMDQIIG